jgi:isoquinoline 1-oxidoreductase beta subunit
MSSTLKVTRRSFLEASGATALIVKFALPTAIGAEAAAAAFQPDAHLRISADNRVTVVVGSSEMGQGVLTAIPMLIAEELDADWSKIVFEQAPADKAFANPMFGMQATGGSTTVRAHWEPLRKAGAAAREMLVAAAAAKWQVDASTLRTDRGTVLGAAGRRASYGSLVAAAARLPVPASPKLKDPRDFKILGKPAKRLDTPAKVNGSARFGLDAHVPGMLVAVMARAPLPGAKATSFDDARARAVRGVRQVIQIPSGVAVLADGYWAAKKGRDALQVQWDLGANAELSSAKMSAMLADGASNANAVARNDGNVADAAAGAGRTVTAQYEVPYLAHACMEPMNCTAWVKTGEAEIWTGTQGQGPMQGVVSQLAGVPPAKVKINTLMLGGGFGRRFAGDFVVDATLLSKMSGKPVKLVYSREDDMTAGFYRPASVAKFEAALDPQGKPMALKIGIGCPSIMAATGGFMKIPESGVDGPAVEGIANNPYDITNQRIAYGRREPGPQVWFWRSVGNTQNIFFMESFIDELAAAAKQDPFEYRRTLLMKQPRHRRVLELAAEKSGWGGTAPTAGAHRGIAVAESFGSYVAEVAEVSVGADGVPKVHRVVAAVDCGMTVNPAIITRQIESAIVFGLSAALYGRITLKDGRVEQANFHQYPVLRMSECPKIEVHILPSSEQPGGVGEPGTPPIAPAVTNAIFAATGYRVRTLPIDPAVLRKA